MNIIAIDPGTTESAILIYHAGTRRVDHPLIASNREILAEVYRMADFSIEALEDSVLVIERMENYGKVVGQTTIETSVWSGRFAQQWYIHRGGEEAVWMPRREVKLHLTGTTNSKDPGVRQALLDRWGGTRQAALGTKSAPGSLYGVHSHLWSALGLAVTYAEQSQGLAKVRRIRAAGA